MAEERKVPTAVGRVYELKEGLWGSRAVIRFEKTTSRGTICPYGLDATQETPGFDLITQEGQAVEVELGGPYGSISRILSVREPEEDVAERVMPALDEVTAATEQRDRAFD